jgi:hypothetical protein
MNIHTHRGVIPVEINLAGEKSHYILIQLFDASTYQVQHFEFLIPTTIVQRFGQWSREDEILIKLKREGFNMPSHQGSKLLILAYATIFFFSHGAIIPWNPALMNQ